MDENEDQGPEWFNQQETKGKLAALNKLVAQHEKALRDACATSTDPDVRAAHGRLEGYTVSRALLRPPQ